MKIQTFAYFKKKDKKKKVHWRQKNVVKLEIIVIIRMNTEVLHIVYVI